MIVKNERRDLPVCLRSFLPQVDTICIIDTGSTDGTIEIAKSIINEHGKEYRIESFLGANDEHGLLCDFSMARNRYVELLRDNAECDYIFSCDADDTYVSPANLKEFINNTKADLYNINYVLNDNGIFIQSFKIFNCSRNRDIKYVGRVHETLAFSWKIKIFDCDVTIKHHPGNHENQEVGTARNMRILKSEIYPPLRSLFYWANENVDSGNYKEAIKWYVEYIRRAKEGEPVWFVELAHCFWRAARWLQHLGHTDHAVALSNELLNQDSSWSEAWCELAHISNINGDIPSMRKYALKALENKYSVRLFSEMDKYTAVPANMLLHCDEVEKSSKK
jgi:glycosyltransferase involved in cell wall biosynthesis